MWRWRVKNIQDLKLEISKGSLKKTMGPFELIMLGLGAIIGTGIFVLTGLAAAKYAGPAITASFLLGAVACIFTALAYAELGSMLPASGGGYSYAYVTFGEPMAAFVGHTMLMVFTCGAATVAAGWSGYAVGMIQSFGITLPSAIISTPFQGGIINLPAVLIILFLTLVLLRGGSGTTSLNNLFVFIKIFAIFIFIIAAIPHVQAVHWTPYAPQGFTGIAQGAGFIFMAYTGFDTLGNAAEECRQPDRDLPIGIIGSLLGSAILYMIVAGLLTAIVPYQALNNAQPMAYALRENGIHVGASLVAAGAIAGMTTVLLTQIYGQSRLLMVMGRDGLFPSTFSHIHPQFETPHRGLLISGLIMAIIAGFFPVSTLGQLSSMATLLIFSLVSLCVMILRYTHPHEHRVFRCPAVYVVASLSTLMCLYLFSQLFLENAIAYVLMSLSGILFYFFYGRIRSRMKGS